MPRPAKENASSAKATSAKRSQELKVLFAGGKAGLVSLTAFVLRRSMQTFVSQIAGESEVRIAEDRPHDLLQSRTAPRAVSGRYANKFASLGAKMNNHPHRSRTLATLRDTLLPKLLSREIDVGEITSSN